MAEEKRPSAFNCIRPYYVSPILANSLELSQINEFHTKGGTGFAAEDGNTLADKFRLRKADVVGTSNVLNGPDRLVDGIQIQTKYYPTAQLTVNSAFDPNSGAFRYHNQLLEVPRDQYHAAVEVMRHKIADGKVPGVTNPDQASDIIKQGYYSYKQARNIARFGNIDSLKYDAKNQCVSTSCMFAIAFVIHYSRSRWNGEDNRNAVKVAFKSSLYASGTTLVSGIVSSQLLRLRAAAWGTVVVRSGLKYVARNSTGKRLIEQIAKGSLGRSVYGAAAVNRVAKLLRSNVLVGTVTVIVSAVPDFARASIRKSISWQQFGKNLLISIGGTCGGIGGWLVGVAAGAICGSVVPIIGTGIGGFVGGLAGALFIGNWGAKATKCVADKLIDDDAVKLIPELEQLLQELCDVFILSDAEMEMFMARFGLSAKFLKQMYRAGAKHGIEGRSQFVMQCGEKICMDLIAKRPLIQFPSNQGLFNELGELNSLALSDLEPGNKPMETAQP